MAHLDYPVTKRVGLTGKLERVLRLTHASIQCAKEGNVVSSDFPYSAVTSVVLKRGATDSFTISYDRAHSYTYWSDQAAAIVQEIQTRVAKAKSGASFSGFKLLPDDVASLMFRALTTREAAALSRCSAPLHRAADRSACYPPLAFPSTDDSFDIESFLSWQSGRTPMRVGLHQLASRSKSPVARHARDVELQLPLCMDSVRLPDPASAAFKTWLEGIGQAAERFPGVQFLRITFLPRHHTVAAHSALSDGDCQCAKTLVSPTPLLPVVAALALLSEAWFGRLVSLDIDALLPFACAGNLPWVATAVGALTEHVQHVRVPLGIVSSELQPSLVRSLASVPFPSQAGLIELASGGHWSSPPRDDGEAVAVQPVPAVVSHALHVLYPNTPALPWIASPLLPWSSSRLRAVNVSAFDKSIDWMSAQIAKAAANAAGVQRLEFSRLEDDPPKADEPAKLAAALAPLSPSLRSLRYHEIRSNHAQGTDANPIVAALGQGGASSWPRLHTVVLSNALDPTHGRGTRKSVPFTNEQDVAWGRSMPRLTNVTLAGSVPPADLGSDGAFARLLQLTLAFDLEALMKGRIQYRGALSLAPAVRAVALHCRQLQTLELALPYPNIRRLDEQNGAVVESLLPLALSSPTLRRVKVSTRYAAPPNSTTPSNYLDRDEDEWKAVRARNIGIHALWQTLQPKHAVPRALLTDQEMEDTLLHSPLRPTGFPAYSASDVAAAAAPPARGFFSGLVENWREKKQRERHEEEVRLMRQRIQKIFVAEMLQAVATRAITFSTHEV